VLNTAESYYLQCGSMAYCKDIDNLFGGKIDHRWLNADLGHIYTNLFIYLKIDSLLSHLNF
jgi:hypothetical protein